LLGLYLALCESRLDKTFLKTPPFIEVCYGAQAVRASANDEISLMRSTAAPVKKNWSSETKYWFRGKKRTPARGKRL